MNSQSLNKKVVKATKWSGITEIVAKLITPVSNMVLARLLAPEAFGVVATLTIIISFAEVFADAGFQKYLVQHDFDDDVDKEQSTNVAFWSNFIVSIIIWAIIAVFSEPLATLVGNEGLGYVLIIASVSIPLQSFSSIQTSLYKRDFDFKTLFKVRIVGTIIPLAVTVPLAFWLRSYWALIWGTIVQNVITAIILTLYSKWKPILYYSISKLKEMLSFTIWSFIETISIWLTGYIDIFIVGTMLSKHYLGLYTTSSALVSQIMGLVTAATTPVLFASLSRLQKDEDEFRIMFFRFQKLVGILIVPLGFGIFCFSDLLTEFFLGEQWMEGAGFVGLWGLTSSVTIVLSHYSSEVYRSKGRPKLSVLAQWLHIIALWPVVLVAVRYGFETLYIARSVVRLELILVNLIIMFFAVNISPLKMINNIWPSLMASVIMTISIISMRYWGDNLYWQIMQIIVGILIYSMIMFTFKEERELFKIYILKIKQ